MSQVFCLVSLFEICLQDYLLSLEDGVGVTFIDCNPLGARTDKIRVAFSWPLTMSLVLRGAHMFVK